MHAFDASRTEDVEMDYCFVCPSYFNCLGRRFRVDRGMCLSPCLIFIHVIITIAIVVYAFTCSTFPRPASSNPSYGT